MAMTSKQFFGIVLLFLVALSCLVWSLRPKPDVSGRTALTWVTGYNPARTEQVALFNDLHPEYDLRIDPDNSGLEKMIVQCVAGVGPDLFDCNDSFWLSAFVKSGIAWDLTGELAAAGIDVRKDTWRATHSLCIYEDRIYGFPRNGGTDALLYNKKLFDAAGLAYPDRHITHDAFLKLAKALTIVNADGRVQQYGFQFSWAQYRHFLRQWDACIYTPDGTRCTLDQPEAIAAVTYLRDLIWEHRVSPTPQQEAAMASAGGFGAGAITLFGGARTAMVLGGRWWLCSLRNRQNFPNLSLGTAECQFGPVRQYRGYGGVVMINRNSPRRKDALKVLRFMAARPYNALINHQADALCPVKAFAEGDRFLHDPDYPEETYNDVWREVMKYGVPDEVSPFINGSVTDRIIADQLDLISNNLKTPEEGLRRATRQINEEIRKTLLRDPGLRERYEALTGKGAGT